MFPFSYVRFFDAQFYGCLFSVVQFFIAFITIAIISTNRCQAFYPFYSTKFLIKTLSFSLKATIVYEQSDV